MNRIIAFAVLFLFLFFAGGSKACTSAIITGKLTPDGRPLLWKHRDTSELNNRIEHFKGSVYNFIALVNSPDRGGIVWSGTNSAGFSIINTASYNLKDDDVEEMDKEGELMYGALSVCKNLLDFEAFLNRLPRPMRVETNVGVIDAEGGAAYYEINNTEWTKLDVNDPKVAPHGFLVVTNFSYTGRIDEGMGYIRYHNAQKIIGDRLSVSGRGITPQWIFNALSRSFYHSLLGIDLKADLGKASRSGWFIDQDFIPRYSSSASVVIQGVRPDETPELTVMWTVLGYPPLGIAVPLFEKSGSGLPSFMTKTRLSENSGLCDRVLDQKGKVFAIRRGSGLKYFNASRLFNESGTGCMQLLAGCEEHIFSAFEKRMAGWRRTGVSLAELDGFYADIYPKIESAYSSLPE
ncbi:MAG: hypothetical protein LBU44_08165 [Mediterranea sp.]|jgi:hypothetical protein|nr:hypothetical protein [Mediterranea sp.]